jgi:hypothetical protein
MVPTDITAVAGDLGADPMDPRTREAQVLGAPVPTVPDKAAQASPVSYASSSAPPFLLLDGRADRTTTPTTCGEARPTLPKTPSTERLPSSTGT